MRLQRTVINTKQATQWRAPGWDADREQQAKRIQGRPYP